MVYLVNYQFWGIKKKFKLFKTSINFFKNGNRVKISENAYNSRSKKCKKEHSTNKKVSIIIVNQQ